MYELVTFPNMAIHELRKLDRTSAGVTLPRDDLRLEGLIDEDGEIDDEQQLVVEREGPGKWVVETVDPDSFPNLND